MIIQEGWREGVDEVQEESGGDKEDY